MHNEVKSYKSIYKRKYEAFVILELDYLTQIGIICGRGRMVMGRMKEKGEKGCKCTIFSLSIHPLMQTRLFPISGYMSRAAMNMIEQVSVVG